MQMVGGWVAFCSASAHTKPPPPPVIKFNYFVAREVHRHSFYCEENVRRTLPSRVNLWEDYIVIPVVFWYARLGLSKIGFLIN